jgi:hypothetical protein
VHFVHICHASLRDFCTYLCYILYITDMDSVHICPEQCTHPLCKLHISVVKMYTSFMQIENVAHTIHICHA